MIASWGGASSWNDLTDKPFGEEVIFEWDGNIEDRHQVTDESGEIPLTYFKVSDRALNYDDFIGLTMSVYGAGTDEFPLDSEVVITEDALTTVNGYAAVSFVIPLIISKNNTVAPKDADTSLTDSMEEGIYVLYATPEGLSALGVSINTPVFCNKLTKFKTIDEEYLPDNIGGGFMLVEVTEETANDGSIILTANATFEEIRQAICNGKQVYAAKGSYFYSLSGGQIPATIFNGISPMASLASTICFVHYGVDVQHALDVTQWDEWYQTR